ncbi:MAG: hypothetical protein J5815_00310 [Clostridia bacterium]|nr:hypothetical protein [Clostridia bacterium]
MEIMQNQNLIYGTYRYSLDDKNRVRVPANFAKALGESFDAMPGRNGCFYLLPKQLVPVLFADYINYNPLDPKNADKDKVARLLFGMARQDLKLDAQSRINLDKDFQKTFELEKELVFVGKATYVEVWPADKWNRVYGDLSPQNLDSILDRLASLGE